MCLLPEEGACPTPGPISHDHCRPGLPGKGDKLALLPRSLQIQGPYYEPSGVLLLMKLSFIQYAYDFLLPRGFTSIKFLKNSLSYCVSYHVTPPQFHY